MPQHRFPPPWSVEEQEACFTVRDQTIASFRPQLAGCSGPSSVVASDLTTFGIGSEADHQSRDGPIECYHCGGPLNGREGRFILKYFLVDRPRKQIRPSRVK